MDSLAYVSYSSKYIRFKYLCNMVASVVTTTSLYPLQARLQHGGQCRVSTSVCPLQVRMRHGGQCCVTSSLCLIKVRMQNGDQCFSYHQFISAVHL